MDGGFVENALSSFTNWLGGSGRLCLCPREQQRVPASRELLWPGGRHFRRVPERRLPEEEVNLDSKGLSAQSSDWIESI